MRRETRGDSCIKPCRRYDFGCGLCTWATVVVALCTWLTVVLAAEAVVFTAAAGRLAPGFAVDVAVVFGRLR